MARYLWRILDHVGQILDYKIEVIERLRDGHGLRSHPSANINDKRVRR